MAAGVPHGHERAVDQSLDAPKIFSLQFLTTKYDVGPYAEPWGLIPARHTDTLAHKSQWSNSLLRGSFSVGYTTFAGILAKPPFPLPFHTAEYYPHSVIGCLSLERVDKQ